MDDTANSIFGDIHNSTIIQMRDGSYPGPRREAYDEPWQRMVESAEVWQHTNPGRDAKQDAIEAAGRLAALRVDIREDPWLDRGFVERFDQRIGGLVKHKLKLRLDPAEAALLALVPLLHQVLWTRAAANACGGQPEVDVSFQRDHARLLNLVTRRPDADAEIRWWLFHRWLSLRIEVVRQESVTELLAEAEFPDYLRAEWVQTLLYALRLEPGVLCLDWVSQQKTYETLFGGSPGEQHVRLPLLGLALSVAHAMAIEATSLSETVVWHVGVPTPVSLEELHKTLATTQWAETTLEATCHHAAVIESLHEHLGRVNSLLQEVSKAAHRVQGLEPLRALPERVNADRVVAAPGPEGRPLFEGWNRFNLDEQRVQELLMGEQLYRDRGLAIRELYQNALDACRYRRAREEYLSRTTGRKIDWVGGIRFEQDIDQTTGRPYLDCVDNGVGMGISELTGVFSRAGAKFADLTEFRDEQANWERLDPPIELFPNSRFGIGVLSYFMLADEITVTTCRLDRKTGFPGPTLQVTIVGPGHLFHIQKVSDSGEPGTRVRLHLRSDKDASCVDVLDGLLGIAEFATSARHNKEKAEWQPGRLRTRKSPYSRDKLIAHGQTVTTRAGTVVWCEYGGAVLVDGLLAHPTITTGILPTNINTADYDLRGAVVNLTGRVSPRLSVDRKEILDDVSTDVERLLSAAIPELVESTTTILDVDWLNAVSAGSTRLADLIFDQWPAVGTFFPADKVLVVEARYSGPDRFDEHPKPAHQDVLDSVLLWRLLAHAPNKALDELASMVPELREVTGVQDARPSDLTLLTGAVRRHGGWSDPEILSMPFHVFEVAQFSGLTPRVAATRLVELGFSDVDPSCFPDRRRQNYDTELELLSVVSPREPLPLGHIPNVSTKLRMAPDEVLDFLLRYGFTPPPTAEEALRSRHLDGKPPWFTSAEQVPLLHAIKFAAAVNVTVGEACQSLRQLGLETTHTPPDWLGEHSARRFLHCFDEPDQLDIGDIINVSRHFSISMAEAGRRVGEIGLDVPAVPSELSRTDHQMISQDLDGLNPWLSRRSPVPPHHFLRAQWKYGMDPRQVADRLRELGYEPTLCEQKPEDFRLLANFDDGTAVDCYKPVTLAQLLLAGRRSSMPIGQVAERLRALGIPVSDVPGMIRDALAKVPQAREQVSSS